jgi:hypothetical protein
MLSTIGRAAIRRVVAPGRQSTNSALRALRHLQCIGTLQHAEGSSALPRPSSYPGRSYATATKTASKSKSATTKTAKPKKKPSAKKVVKKPVKKVAKKKKVVKKLKAKPRGRPRKIPTEEEKKKAALKVLKATALSPPKQKPQTAWTVLAAESAKANPSAQLGSEMKAASTKYKSLTPAELEVLGPFLDCLNWLTHAQHYNHLANVNRDANGAAYKQWVESHTPEQIRVANNARLQLKLKDPIHTWRQIHDDRIPKRPSSPMLFFMKERHASGDFKGIGLAENSRLMSREWAALSPSERKVRDP